MGKKHKQKNRSQAHPPRKYNPSSRSQSTATTNTASTVETSQQNVTVSSPSKPTSSSKPLQPEQMSLEAYRHIQLCLTDKKSKYFQKEDVTAVVQLAQHLRVFGLLSAVGYIRHAREGKIRERIRPVWTPLLWSLICGDQPRPSNEQQTRQDLMNTTYNLSIHDQKGYMVKWRQALKLSNHWNFWARACQEEETDEQRTENGNTAS